MTDGEHNSGDARRDQQSSPPLHPPAYSENGQEQPRNENNINGSSYASSYRLGEAQGLSRPTATQSHHDLASIAHEENAAHVDHPPPAYSEFPGTISDEGHQLGANATVAADGRVNINIDQKTRGLSQLIAPQLQRQLTRAQEEPAPPPPYIPESLGGAPGQKPPPPLNIVIQVVGSRGDVQPFVALGKVLKETYGHRVRLATHATFKDFVSENGLEFFSIGGDPAELMAFMVKNPGLMPGFDTLRSGEVGKRRRGIAEILRGTWRSCIETGDGLSVDPLKQTVEEWMGIEDQLPDELKKTFVADAIIANPPSFGHIHCAEKLGIPLHIMFTMPWSPTQQFPHPLANIQSTNTDANITNFMSYILVDMLTWQGLGDLINRFRKELLSLDPISLLSSPAMLERLKIPHTYCWSPALIPKPKDWAPHISIAGFFFLNLATNYTPAPDLAAFLAAGEPPVYIGFGSIVVDDPNVMTTLIFDAVKATGRRALVSKGWGGFGGDDLNVPEGVFMLGNVPHDWLFKHVAAVVHHGGAGTTAAGIAAGRPTVVVPFFGDQPFWGAMVAKAGAGPDPIPYKDLSAEKLANAIKEALKPESLEKAAQLSARISKEQGAQIGAQSFHQTLKYEDLRCAVAPNHPAVWRVKRTQVRLSAKAATVLTQEGELSFSDLKLFRPREYIPDEGPWDPVTGAASAIVGTAGQVMMGVADFPIETLKLLNIHPDSRKGKGKAKQSEEGDTPESGSRAGREPVPKDARSRDASSSTSLTQRPGTPDGLEGSMSQVPVTSDPTSPRADSNRSGFMAQAMRQSSQVSHSRSPSRDRFCPRSPSHSRRSSQTRAAAAPGSELRDKSGSVYTDKTGFSDKMFQMNQESIVGTGKGVGRIVGAGFKSPLDFSMNIAQGFHNMPKLYGGEVRQVDKVTGFQSGLKTAAKQFGFGLYDGIAGIVTDPYKGAKKEGGVGFVKGVGRGIFSVPLRVMGGAWSVPAYAMKGLYQEMLKNKGSNVQNYIIAARISQGYDETSVLSQAEKTDMVNAWRNIKTNVKKKSNPGDEQLQALHSFMRENRERKTSLLEKLKKREGSGARDPRLYATDGRGSLDLPEPILRTHTAGSAGAARSSREIQEPLQHLGLASTYPEQAPPHPHRMPSHQSQGVDDEAAERAELEAAISASVAETSRGNTDDDELIARAIRASMMELQREPQKNETEEEALQRAMAASMEEAQKSGISQDEQRILEEALCKSMLETSRARREHGTDSEWDSNDTEDDADYQRILAESEKLHQLHGQGTDEYYTTIAGTHGAEKVREDGGDKDDEEEVLRKAIEESERAAQDHESNLQKQRTEEDIVMEYVKKQSLAEEEHRQRVAQGRDTSGESAGGPA
ncbi:UDP-Glycosyltransferase/glycogen phosphorylase [Bimuria novae-zelandiae CBS 107.79]|uniref:UDP-Glycosyltransferase/glycogen phosphorylase n=1 Tax=Bimuria novae-zelandiae CBS 107.79 TaxID=1447943 RepID=A0A6A5V4N3_9PLEO|nr:UDP-Glycosyltransferase/glycogen phosphorylase [Bimuria novae-zelandiae CBS 107.79]